MKKDNTLLGILLGLLLIGILQQVIVVLFFEKIGYHSLGLWSGIASAAICVIHMKRSIEDALDLGEEKRAAKHVVQGYATRMIIVAVLVGLVLYFKIGNPITILTGVIALKPAVYMQPLMHKVLKKLQKEKKGGT